MKKLHTSALAALLLSTSFATADVAAPTGFYVGVQQGYNMLDNKFKDSFTDSFELQNLKASEKNSGIIGELLLGGRMTFGSGWTTGLEVAFGTDSNKSKKTLRYISTVTLTTLFNREVKRNYFITPALVLGKNLCSKWHVFLKLGLGFSKFQSKITDLTSIASFKKSKTKMGFAPAIGAEYAINRAWSVQGSVGGEWYRNVKHTVNPTLVGVPGSIYKGKINPTYVNCKIGLLYKF